MFWILIWILFALWGCTYVEEGTEEREPLHLTFLDVGQGLAVLLEQGGRFALYDAGPDSSGIADTLEARGIRELDWVVLSHNHRDHVGGFVELAKVRVGRLYVGPDTAGGVWRDSVLYVALRQGIPVDTLVRGDMLGLGGGANGSAVDDELPELRVLWPPDYETVSENHGSVVLEVSWGAGSALLTGDLDSLGERKLLELSPTLSAGLLQVPHHGSAGSSSLAFLAQVSPEYAVVSVGDGNPYGHPAQAVSQKLKYVLGDSLRFFRTDLQGSVSFELSRDFGAIPLTVPKR
jgi:competence protein ComEC